MSKNRLLVLTLALLVATAAWAGQWIWDSQQVTVSTGYGTSDTSIVLVAGQGAKLPAPSGAIYTLDWFNPAFAFPYMDPNDEHVLVQALSTDTLTVQRGVDGLGPFTHNTAGVTYVMNLYGYNVGSLTPTPTITSTPGNTATPTPTNTPTNSPTATPTNTPVNTMTPTPLPKATVVIPNGTPVFVSVPGATTGTVYEMTIINTGGAYIGPTPGPLSYNPVAGGVSVYCGSGAVTCGLAILK